MEKYKGATVGVAGTLDIDRQETWKQTFNWIKKICEKIQAEFPKLLLRIKIE